MMLSTTLAGCGAMPAGGAVSYDGKWAVFLDGGATAVECVVIFDDEIVQSEDSCMLPSNEIVNAQTHSTSGSTLTWPVTIKDVATGFTLDIKYDVQVQKDGTLAGTRTSTDVGGATPGMPVTHNLVMQRM